MVWSFVYLALRRSLELILLCFRSAEAKEIEILVLRHELALPGRQHPPPRLQPKDHALLAALSRLLPRTLWSVFLVQPEPPRPPPVARATPRPRARRWGGRGERHHSTEAVSGANLQLTVHRKFPHPTGRNAHPAAAPTRRAAVRRGRVLPEPIDQSAEGNALICCSQPQGELVLDL